MSDNKITASVSANTGVTSTADVFNPFSSIGVNKTSSYITASDLDIQYNFSSLDVEQQDTLQSVVTADKHISLSSATPDIDVVSSLASDNNPIPNVDVYITNWVLPKYKDTIHSLESISLNVSRPVADIFTVGDSVSLQPNKYFYDSLSSSDTVAKFFEKSISDYVTISDYFNTISDTLDQYNDITSATDTIVIVTDYNRTFTDTTTSSDHLAFDTAKPVSDSSTATDTRHFVITKSFHDNVIALDSFGSSIQNPNNVFASDTTSIDESFALHFIKNAGTDTVISNDSTVLTVVKGVTDTQDIIDGLYFVITKGLSDAAIANDNLAADFTKVLSDSAIPDDSIVLSIGYGRFFSDSIDNITDTRRFDVTKGATDTITAADNFVRTVDFNRAFNDIVTITDLMGLGPNNYNTDTTTTSDTMSFHATKGLSDTLTLSDTKVFSMSKVLSDSVTVTDSIFTGGTNNFDDTTSTTDNATWDFTKSLSDNLNPSDSMVLSSNKGITDTATSTDTKSWVFTKSLTDIATAEDLIGVADGLTFTYGKSRSDTIETSDSFSRTVLWQRAFIDTQTINDSLSFTFDMGNIGDTVTSGDTANMTVGLNKFDTVTGSDAGYAVWQSYTVDNTYFAEDYVGGTRTF